VGKYYVGQTGNIPRRFAFHSKADGNCPEFHRAVSLYGIDSFAVQIVEETENQDEADRLEAHYIIKFNALSPHGYNLTLGGKGVRFEPGAKLTDFIEELVSEEEIRNMAQRVADGKQEGEVIGCPCCGELTGNSCRCGVAPEFARRLLYWVAAGGTAANLPLDDIPHLLKQWRPSREANRFLVEEKRAIKGRTNASVAPAAIKKYVARFWPYLEYALRQRCLREKNSPCSQLPKFRPLLNEKNVENKKIKVERLLRRYRRELGVGEPNIVFFMEIMRREPNQSGKLFEAVLSVFHEYGGTEAEIAEAVRRAALVRADARS